MSVEKFKIQADTIIHISGFACRLVHEIEVETNPNNAIAIQSAEVWPSKRVIEEEPWLYVGKGNPIEFPK